MKVKFALIPVVAALAAGGCGSDEYGEFRQALRHQYRMMAEFTRAAGRVAGPEEASAALEQFRREAVTGREWMLRLTTEHPGLADLDKANLPEDVRADLDRIEEVTPRFVAALLRVEQEYGGDPGVRRTLDEMGSVISLPLR